MKDQQPYGWHVPSLRFEGRPWLYREVVLTKEGVGTTLSISPATIVQARYDGSYEGAPWLCFPLHPTWLKDPAWYGWDGDERECTAFWESARIQNRLIGRGHSPTAAYNDLIDQACRRLGIDRAALTEQPV
jgi:hypothetical protein